MRTKFFAIAALVLGLASCQRDFAPEGNVGGEVDFRLEVSAPELGATRADADAYVIWNGEQVSLQAIINGVLASGLSFDRIIEMMDAETWLSAEQCIELGLADKFAEKDADMAKAKEILQKANMNLEQRINIQKSLAAQLRELTEISFEPKKKEEKQEEKTGNIMEMLTGFFNN